MEPEPGESLVPADVAWLCLPGEEAPPLLVQDGRRRPREVFYIEEVLGIVLRDMRKDEERRARGQRPGRTPGR